MRIVITNNHSMLNAGDHMIMRETLRMLRTTMPNAQVELIFNHPDYARSVVPDCSIHPSPITWVTSLQPDGTYRMGGRWRRWSNLALLLFSALFYRFFGVRLFPFLARHKRILLSALADADLVLVCGGGNFYTTNAGDGLTGWFGFTLSCCAVALLMGRPVVLLPQSIGPFHSSTQRRAMAAIVRHARLTCVRERVSLRVLHELGSAQKALYVPDLAFGAQSEATAAASALLDRTGVTGSKATLRVGMSIIDWQTQYPLFSRQCEYEDAVIGFINTMTAQGGQIVLFGQSCGPSAHDDDRRINTRIYARVADPQSVYLVNEVVPPDVLQAAYGAMDYFVGTRMHSVILALNAGTRVLTIGYLHKTRGVFETLGLQEQYLDINTITAAQLIAAFEQLGRAPQHQQVDWYLAHARRSKRSLAQILVAIAER